MMSVKYDFYPTPLRKFEKQEKYHVRMLVKHNISTGELADKIAKRSTMHQSDVIVCTQGVTGCCDRRAEEWESGKNRWARIVSDED